MRFMKILAALSLLVFLVIACDSAAPAPTTAPTQPPTAVPTATPVPPTATPVPPTATPTPKPLPPVAKLEIVPVAANAGRGVDKGDPNVMTATIKMMTDTAVGPFNTTIALGAPGLTNHPVGVPVHLSSMPVTIDAKAPVTRTAWTLTAPPGSKATLQSPSTPNTEFTPDVPGMYRVTVVLGNIAGNSTAVGVQIHAGTYIGVDAGNCQQCHPSKVANWSKTGHASALTSQLEQKSSLKENCVRCHATGYYPGTTNGGFTDVQAKLNWQFPTNAQIAAGGNWSKMPAELKNMGNIQCEACHGPAAQHAKDGKDIMASDLSEATCNVCHNAGGLHLKGTDLKAAGHSDEAAAAWNEPTGASRQACARCHTGSGYVSFLADPKNPAAWSTEKQTVSCATCHDPHGNGKVYQLRVVGKPIELPFEAKDVGLSATCFECHNARVSPAQAATGSTPHYNSIAEFLSDTGGVDYGQKIANSGHGSEVGVKPVENPAYAKNPNTNKFLFSPVGDEKGITPGPCVTCHMWPTIEDEKDPNWHKVGAHSFNTVSPDGKFNYTAACQQCHDGIKDTFNIKAQADYDGNGKVEGVQDEVKGLLDVLFKALTDAGVKRIENNPYLQQPTNTTEKIRNAVYNFRTVYGVMWGPETGNGNQGKAQALHNFKRSVMLLQLSYKDLTGKDVPNATLMK